MASAADGRRGVRVVVADGRGRAIAAPGVARWLARVAPRRAAGTVTVALVSDRRVRELNRQYRGIDRATDVLSFSMEGRKGGRARKGAKKHSVHSFQPVPPFPPLPPLPPFLGDIVIARGVARRQAREAGHSEGVELRVLALHGLLHLLGYDHERDHGRMRRIERRLRKKGGLREGLIERAEP